MAFQLTAERAQSGSFEDFHERARPRALRLAALLTQRRDGAEDLVQEAFASVYQRWNRLDQPGPYLRTVIVNAARTRHRRERRERERTVKLGPCGATSLHADEIADALAALPYRQRAVIVLRYYADLSEREIAEALDCRVGTVKSLASRALARLREDIEQ
ncbi:MAG: SigE family RNA polymerase sigma factor [Actinomycetota bacterium]